LTTTKRSVQKAAIPAMYKGSMAQSSPYQMV
jgi:hypothetical protein